MVGGGSMRGDPSRPAAAKVGSCEGREDLKLRPRGQVELSEVASGRMDISVET